MIDNPDCTIDDLMQHIKGPDFPTGGIILGRRGIREAYYTGHGRIDGARENRHRGNDPMAAAASS